MSEIGRIVLSPDALPEALQEAPAPLRRVVATAWPNRTHREDTLECGHVVALYDLAACHGAARRRCQTCAASLRSSRP